RWGLGVTLPTRVFSMGGHFMFDDDQLTPNTQVSNLEFNKNGKKVMIVFEVRHWMSNNEAGVGQRRDDKGLIADSNCIGNIFYGSGGYMALDGEKSHKNFPGQNQEARPSRTAGGGQRGKILQTRRHRKAQRP